MNSVSMKCSVFEVVMEMVEHITLRHLHQIQILMGDEKRKLARETGLILFFQLGN